MPGVDVFSPGSGGTKGELPVANTNLTVNSLKVNDSKLWQTVSISDTDSNPPFIDEPEKKRIFLDGLEDKRGSEVHQETHRTPFRLKHWHLHKSLAFELVWCTLPGRKSAGHSWEEHLSRRNKTPNWKVLSSQVQILFGFLWFKIFHPKNRWTVQNKRFTMVHQWFSQKKMGWKNHGASALQLKLLLLQPFHTSHGQLLRRTVLEIAGHGYPVVSQTRFFAWPVGSCVEILFQDTALNRQRSKRIQKVQKVLPWIFLDVVI